MMSTKFAIFIFIFGIILPFTANAQVNLINPEGDKVYEAGEKVTIEWENAIDHGDCVWDLYFTTDGGSTWNTLETEIPKYTTSYTWSVPDVKTMTARIKVIQNNEDYPNLSDQSSNFPIGETLNDSSFDTTATDVQQIQQDRFTVRSIYPNPFKTSMNISLDMHRSAKVEVTIYNIQGHKITTLLKRRLNQGKHKISWEAGAIAQGIYLCRITSGSVETTRRIVHSN